MEGYKNLKELIEPVYPGLFDSIQNKIRKAEKDYEKESKKDLDSFLWEHSVFAATVSLKICRMENKDPLIPVIASLFHDIGKFLVPCFSDNLGQLDSGNGHGSLPVLCHVNYAITCDHNLVHGGGIYHKGKLTYASG